MISKIGDNTIVREAGLDDCIRFCELAKEHEERYSEEGFYADRYELGKKTFDEGTEDFHSHGQKYIIAEDPETREIYGVCHLKAWDASKIKSSKFKLNENGGMDIVGADDMFFPEARLIEIGGLYVPDRYRNNGIGRAIGESAVDSARALMDNGQADGTYWLVKGNLKSILTDGSDFTYAQMAESMAKGNTNEEPGKYFNNLRSMDNVLTSVDVGMLKGSIGNPTEESMASQKIADMLAEKGKLDKTDHFCTINGGRYYTKGRQ